MKKIKKYLPLLFFVIFMIMSIVIPFKYYMIKKYNYILPNEYVEVFKKAKKLEIKNDIFYYYYYLLLFHKYHILF
jgi:hypothetical protein